MIDKKVKIGQGDLAVHSSRAHMNSSSAVEKLGLVLQVNPTLGSGFRSAEVMWCESGKIETVMINYLKTVQKL